MRGCVALMHKVPLELAIILKSDTDDDSSILIKFHFDMNKGFQTSIKKSGMVQFFLAFAVTRISFQEV